MPTLSTFFGITIRMYYNDHDPAHFHAYYAEYDAICSIESLEVIQGELPRRAMALVVEWAIQYRPALRENWERARTHEPLLRIPPLE